MMSPTGLSMGPPRPHRMTRWRPPVSGSAPHRVAQVDHTVAEPSMVQQLQVESNAVGESRLAAAHGHRAQKQHALVDQPVPERLSPDGRTADAQVRGGRLLEPSYRVGLELPLDSRARG